MIPANFSTARGRDRISIRIGRAGVNDTENLGQLVCYEIARLKRISMNTLFQEIVICFMPIVVFVLDIPSAGISVRPGLPVFI